MVITGANGHLGQRMLQTWRDSFDLVALVRSEGAMAQLTNATGQGVTVAVVDYADADTLRPFLDQADCLVHLSGIIKQSARNTFTQAHEDTARAVAAAAAGSGLQGIIYLSILGAELHSDNDCLLSKARAEAILMAAEPPCTVLQVPMVLGEGDFASLALSRKAARRWCFEFNAESYEQPVYAGDLVVVVQAHIEQGCHRQRQQLAGPEALTRRALIQRAAAVLGNSPHVISLPVSLGYFIAAIFEMISSAPPVTRAMLGVLNHDDHLDVPDDQTDLTDLDTMLRRVISP
ncbi:MAG: NAD(P)H-binding protein [Pseudomonadales bacterium]|nr:NAD(P)H-binding protein [Pseudomonadales bacterium]